MSSGASTPQGSRSPPPPEGVAGQQGARPSPLAIGKRFVKQYYQVLMTTPDQIYRFYQPTSVLSDGEGSSPTDPVSFETVYDGTSAEKLKDRFFEKDLHIRFEFEHGAIDAQESVNGGLLLVVTGHVVYVPSASEDEDAAVDDPIRKGFVHTFFLNMNTAGSKKSYYVHNDILRFLKNPSEVAPVSSITEGAEIISEPVAVAATADEPSPPEPVVEPPPQPPPQPPAPVETKPEVLETTAPPPPTTTEEEVAEAPGGGAEETKEELPDVTPTPVSKPPPKADKASTKKASPKKVDAPAEKDAAAKGAKSSFHRNKAQGDGAAPADTGRKSPVPPSSPAPKPAPGSWASLVAGAGGGGGGGPASTGSAVKAPPPALPPKSVPAPEKAAHSQAPSNEKKESTGTSNPVNNNTSSNNNHKMGGNNNNMRPPKRDPDCTLVIKNLADNTKESDVLGLFEPFAAQTKSRVVGITVAAHRGIAFVDYDSVNPVMKAVDLHQKEPMRLMGRVLEVDQKTAEQRARRAAQQRGGGGGGNYRSGSPNNGGMNRYGGGGRGGHRRRDGGRGDRGGGGGRDGGGRGGRGGR